MRLAKGAYILAFVIAAAMGAAALLAPVVALPMSLIPALAGIGILRRRAWGAYGFALHLGLLPVFFLTRAIEGNIQAEAWVSLVLALPTLAGMALLYFVTGRSMTAAGARGGWPVAWIASAAACGVLLFSTQLFTIPNRFDGRHSHDRRPRPFFRYPVDRQMTFVMRVVGAPGDRIRIARKKVYCNGRPITAPYASNRTVYLDSYRDNFPSEPNVRLYPGGQEMLDKHVVDGEVVVPDGHYFVLGDNHDSSLDSRNWGFVPEGNIFARPLLVIHSVDRDEAAGTQTARWNRLLKRF